MADNMIDPEKDWAGETRNDPEDGNAYVLRSVNAEDRIELSGVYVEINDVMGGHHRYLSLSDWLAWEIA